MPLKGETVDEYIKSFPADVQAKLETLRRTIRKAVPEAEETVSYRMPAYMYHGRLLYFAAFNDHISLFPTGSEAVRRDFKKQLSRFGGSKGTIQFPLDRPLPLRLVREIALFRARENLARTKKKKMDKPPTKI